MSDNGTTIEEVMNSLGKPLEVCTNKSGKISMVKWREYARGCTVEMKVTVSTKSVTVRVTDHHMEEAVSAFRYYVEDLFSVVRIYHYFILTPAEFAWQCGFVLKHDAETCEWTARDTSGRVMYRRMGSYEISTAIFERMTGLRAEGQ